MQAVVVVVSGFSFPRRLCKKWNPFPFFTTSSRYMSTTTTTAKDVFSEVTDENFQEQVLNEKNKVVIVDFYAE